MTMTPSKRHAPSELKESRTHGLRRINLGNNWSVTPSTNHLQVPADISGRTFTAAVPGCVHTDLLAANAIRDPYIDRNDELLQWIGETSWQYTCDFTWQPDGADHIELCCEGLDTVAELRLNGKLIGNADNMHLGYRFDLSNSIRPGANQLVINFAAPLPYAETMQKRMGALPYAGTGSNTPHPHNMMRKMACNFGWDWGPVLLTAGIWRPIYIESWSGARIDSVRPLITRADTDFAAIDVMIDLGAGTKLEGYQVNVTLTDPEGKHVAAEAFANLSKVVDGQPVQLEVTKPRRWWPIGYGEQPLYTLTVSLYAESNETELQAWTRKIGLKTSRLVTDPDLAEHSLGKGSTFHIEVNGQRVYCKGANWIPDDCFPTRVTPQRYRSQIETAVEANMNMLRVWGGGIYEDHAFYEVCDELGVMVWQDFTMACACYHEDDPFASWIDAEARYNITRLSSHASLVLWNGCNENVLGVYEWSEDWRDMRANGKPWGLKYYLEIIPSALSDLDPSKPYWPASPYSGSPDTHPNAEEHGNCHIWDVWNGEGNARNYLSHYPRFASEFGFHGPPTFPTIERSIPEDQRYFDSPAMIHHNRHAGGQSLANERMADYFIPPDNFDDWLYLAQVVQARSLAMGVEWFRALSPWNSGVLYWQFNDCWPVASWSAVDGDQRRKPLWYATRRFLADRLLAIRPAHPTPNGASFGPLAAYLHNDHPKSWQGTLVVMLHTVTVDSPELLKTIEVDVPPRGSLKIDLPPDLLLSPDMFLVGQIADTRAYWWPHPDHLVSYQPAELSFQISNPHVGIYQIGINSQTLVRDLCIFADRLASDAQVSDQLLTLLPGESTCIYIHSHEELSESSLTRYPILQCANNFGLK
ncbi:MAG: glycoside hydrolase family 2 protein [Planctomycetota bacterium]